MFGIPAMSGCAVVSSFETCLCGAVGSLTLSPSLLDGLGKYMGWKAHVSPLIFSVSWCLEVIATLRVAMDTYMPCSRLLFHLASPPL